MWIIFYYLYCNFSNRRVQCLYEACVGAGLPVIHTLNDMVQVGDHVSFFFVLEKEKWKK